MPGPKVTGTKGAPPSKKIAAFERVLAEATALALPARLRLLDALKAAAVVESDDGVRFHTESLSEFKRARRYSKSGPIATWIESFGPDDVFFDVGANTGTVALLAARLHDGRVPVFAIEPAADNFAALVRNIRANGREGSVTPLHLALFDRTGVEILHRASLGAGTALHAVGDALDYTRQPFVPAAGEPVLAFRLDDLIERCGLPSPTRLKIDVDGFEDRVLAGATRVLSAGRCELFVELVAATPDDPHPDQLTRMLAGFGYAPVQVVEHHGPGTYPRITDVRFTRA